MAGTTDSQLIPYVTLGDTQKSWPAKTQAAAERVDVLLDAIATALAGKLSSANGSVTTAKLADGAVTAAKAAADIATQAELDAVAAAISAALADHADNAGDGGHIDQQAAIADLAPAVIDDPADAPVDADALREDLVATTLPDIATAITDLTDKVNTILAALRTAGVIAP